MITPKPSLISILALAVFLLAAAGCTKEARKNRSVARGDKYFAADKLDAAEIEYRQALQIGGLDATAIRQLGYLYLEEGRLPLAYVYLQKASEQQPDDSQIRLKLGRCEMAVGMVKEARVAAVRVLQAKPVAEDALLLLASASRTPSDVADAQKTIANLRLQDTDRPGYHLATGIILMRKPDPDGAESEFAKALQLDPKSSDAYAELGEVYWRRREMDKADKALKSAADLAPLRSIRRLRYAEFKVKTGAVSEAKKMLDDLTAKAPDYIPAWVFTMKLAYEERKFDDCAAIVDKIINRDSSNYEALLERSALHLLKGDAAKAVTELEYLNSNYGHVAQLKYRLAVAYLQNGEPTKAENMLYQALQIAPDDSAALQLMAELNLRKGNPNAAIGSLLQVLKAAPQDERAYLLLARAYLAQKNLNEALAVYKKLEDLAPKDPQVPFLMGMVELSAGRLVDARGAFERSLAIAPDWSRSLEMLVNLDLAEKRFAAASKRVVGLMHQYPKAAGPWVLMYKIHLAEHDNDAAEADLLKAIDLDPNYQRAYLQLAKLYVATNKHQLALDKLKAIADKTKSVYALYQIGLIREELKEYGPAREAFERLLSIDPKNVPALDNLARLFAENLGQPDKALELAKKAQELQPDDARASDTLGSVLYKRGEYHAALSYLAAATEKEPTEVDYRYHLAMAHYMLGEEDQARLAFRDVIASGNASLAKEEARRRLAFLDIDPATASAAAQTALEERVKSEPNDPVARVRLAAIQARKGGGADAAAGFEATLKLNPRDVSVMLELVRLYSGSLHNPTRARELAKNAHEVAPNDPQISRTLGELLYSNGDYAWSLDLLQQSAKDLQGDPALTFDLARSYYCTGKVSAAEDALKAFAAGGATGPTAARASELSAMISGGKSVAQAQAALPGAQKILATSPNDIPATMVVALAREGQGDIPEARRLYEKMLDEDPLFAPATRQLAHIYSERLEDEPKAYEFATKAHEAFPDDPESDKVLGMLDYRKGDYAGAAHYLQESFRLRNDDGETLYYLGMSHFQLKDMTSSRSELQRAVAMNLPDDESDGAKRTLDQINGPGQGHALSEIPIH